MTVSELHDEANVVRYIRPRAIYEDNTLDSRAFYLRSGEDGLSVHWLEYFGNLTKEQQLQEIRPLIRLNMSRNGRLAELNVGVTKSYLRQQLGLSLSFERKPLAAEGRYPADGSHCEITGLHSSASPEAELIGDLIAECVHALHHAVAP